MQNGKAEQREEIYIDNNTATRDRLDKVSN